MREVRESSRLLFIGLQTMRIGDRTPAIAECLQSERLLRFRTPLRFAIPLACISLLLLVVGVSGAWYVDHLERQTSKLLEQNVASIRAAEELEVYLLQVRYELNQYLISEQREELKDALALRDDIEEWVQRSAQLAASEREQTAMNSIRNGLTQLFDKLQEIHQANDHAQTRSEIDELVEHDLSENILPHALRLLDINELELEASSAANQQLANRVALAFLMLGLCGSVAGLVAGYGFARGLSQSIVKLSLPVRDVAGQLSEIVGPVSMSADPGLDDLENVLNSVSQEVGSVIQQLHDRQQEVLRSDQLAALGQLAAGLAHELRNPLMCMTVLVQSALSNPGQSLDERDLQVLNDEMQRLDRLLQEFLDYARPAKLELTDIDLGMLLQQTVELISVKAKKNEIQLRLHQTDAQVKVRADDKQLRQVVVNLLLNAIDATAPMKAVDIRLKSDAHDQRFCNVEIIDDGPGLSELELTRAFEPFFSTKEGGLGMGLVTCRRIVQSHNGELYASNSATRGAVFTFRLPTLLPLGSSAVEPPIELLHSNEGRE